VRKILLLAWNDVRLTSRDRASLIWMLVLPIALIWFFGQMGGQGGGRTKFSLAVVDKDRGWVARAFVAELGAGNVELREIDPAEVEGDAKKVRWIVLPEGFTAKVLAGEQQKLRLEMVKSASSDFSRAAEVHVVRAIARTLALLVEMKQSGAIAAAEPQAEYARLESRPPLVALDVSTAGRGHPVPSGLAQSVPGILTMVVLMMTVIYGGVFLTLEKREGMLRRQFGLPVSRGQIVMGKLCGRLFVAGIQIVLLVLVGRIAFRFDFGASVAGLVLILASYAFAVAGLATLLGAVLRTPEQASAIGWISSMVMAAMGGCWWPSEVVPRWLWHASHIFPTAWAMDALHALISFGRGLDAVVVPAAVLIGFGLVFSALGARYISAASA
jgi:ABC-2 type transport system permease protein